MRPKPRVSGASGELPTRAEILEAFRGARHTRTSQRVLDGIERGDVRVTFRKNLRKRGEAGEHRMFVRREPDISGILGTIVHEGRHCLDIRSGLLPAINPGGVTCLVAEMVAWRAEILFVVRNGFSRTQAFRMADMGPQELAINLLKGYEKRIGEPLTDDELLQALRMFEERQDAIQDS